MRGILICPFTTTVKEVQVTDELDSWYEALTPEHVDWSVSVVSMVTLTMNEDLWVDEEGLFKPGSPSFLLKDVTRQPLFGRGLIIGTNPKSGNSRDSRLLLTQVQSIVMWMPFVTRVA